jgi:2'-5' RNA ligase
MARCFIAIDLPREAINEIKRIQILLKKKNLFTGKFTEPENLHLTLKFLGEIDDEKIENARKKLSEIEFHKIIGEIGEIGVFDRNFIKIIWIKLNGKGIFDLQRKIDEKLKDLFPAERRFMSHITFARVKKVNDKKEFLEYLKSIKPSKISFNADRFFLKKSDLKPDGPVYEDLQEFKSVKAEE